MRPRRHSSSNQPRLALLVSRATGALVASVPATTTLFLMRELRSLLLSSKSSPRPKCKKRKLKPCMVGYVYQYVLVRRLDKEKACAYTK